MLRYGYLPSDFNPMVLMLGEAEDLAALAATLRDFARDPRPILLSSAGLGQGAEGAEITLSPDGRRGMRRLGEGHFAWALTPGEAADHADLVESLTADDPAGSEMLGPEAASDLMGLPVKVSRGEYRDDFITP